MVDVSAENGGSFAIHFTFRKEDQDRIGEVAMTGEVVLTEGPRKSAEVVQNGEAYRMRAQGGKEEAIRTGEVIQTGEAALSGGPHLSDNVSRSCRA